MAPLPEPTQLLFISISCCVTNVCMWVLLSWLTFFTGSTAESWAALPLQRGHSAIHYFIGRSDHGPVAGKWIQNVKPSHTHTCNNSCLHFHCDYDNPLFYLGMWSGSSVKLFFDVLYFYLFFLVYLLYLPHLHLFISFISQNSFCLPPRNRHLLLYEIFQVFLPKNATCGAAVLHLICCWEIRISYSRFPPQWQMIHSKTAEWEEQGNLLLFQHSSALAWLPPSYH